MLIDVSTPLPREFCRQHRRHDRWIAKQEDQFLSNKYQANADQPAVLIVTTNQDDYIYNNQFVACLCQGQTASTAALGNSTISASASTCSTCATTPSLIVQNINDFLDICTVQAQNGTASGALTYRPQVYNTNTTDPQPAEYYS